MFEDLFILYVNTHVRESEDVKIVLLLDGHSSHRTLHMIEFGLQHNIFFFYLFMSDAHHGINSSTQKYQSTQSNVALTSCRQDSGSPPF